MFKQGGELVLGADMKIPKKLVFRELGSYSITRKGVREKKGACDSVCCMKI